MNSRGSPYRGDRETAPASATKQSACTGAWCRERVNATETHRAKGCQMGRRRWIVAGALLVFSLIPLASALATGPGINGDIAFRRYLGSDRTQGAIFIAHSDGTGERQLSTPPAKGGDDSPDVSPDGRFVAFERCDEVICPLYPVNTDGSGLHRVGPACHKLPPK